MAKIGRYLLLLAVILPRMYFEFVFNKDKPLFILLDFISAWFPGDHCCVRWNSRRDCCLDRFGGCCGG